MIPSNEERSVYAPIRMRSDVLWMLAKELSAQGFIIRDGRIAGNLYDMIDDALIKPGLEMIGEQQRAGELDGEAAGRVMAKLVSFRNWVPLIGQYELCGRQIFDLHDRLTELLSHTDLGECTLEHLHYPYDAFYVRFGMQEHIKLPFDEGTWEYVDGAFVGWAGWDDAGNKRIKIGLSMVHGDGSRVLYPGYFFDLLPDELRLPVPAAIDAALQRSLAAHAEAQDDNENHRALKAHQREEIEATASVLRDAAALLINSLFYLESIRTNLPDLSPGRDTPPDRHAQWMQSPPQKRHKQHGKLTADGYALVRLVGSEVEASATIGHGSGTVKVHWRRGHWRWQPYGEHRAMNKRIWIKPVLVGGDPTTETSIPGHIYVAPTSNKVQ